MNKISYPDIGETLYEQTLSNGLRLLVVTKPGYTRSFAMFATDYGGADRRFKLAGMYRDTPAGVAHFLEHKMFDMPDGDNALSSLAANGAQPNAFTSSCMTAYYFESTENFYENLDMLLKFVSTPYFTDESVQKEQGIIGQEIRMCEDTPDYVIYDELMRSLYEHNPVRDSVAGTVESIAEITPETLYGCHKIFYNPSNMCLAVVGDVDPEKVLEASERILTSEHGEIPERDYGEAETPHPARERYEKAMEVSAPQLLAGCKIAPAAKGEALLRQKLTGLLAVSYLFGQSSPLYSRLYQKGLVNTDFAGAVDYSAGTMTFMVGGETAEPYTVLDEIKNEIRKTLDGGMDEALFERIKKASYGARIRALSSFAGLCSSMCDGAFGGYNCMESFRVVEEITSADVLGFIRDGLRPEDMASSVILPVGRQPEEE